MGVRFDRENGYYGKRRWTFDIDEFLMGVLWCGLVVLLIVFGLWLRRR